MIVKRIYLQGAKYSKSIKNYLKGLKVINGTGEVIKSANGVIVECNFEITNSEMKDFYILLKENTGADTVYSKKEENELYIKKVRPKPEIKPQSIFDKPDTIWNIDGIPHKKNFDTNKWEPIHKHAK